MEEYKSAVIDLQIVEEEALESLGSLLSDLDSEQEGLSKGCQNKQRLANLQSCEEINEKSKRDSLQKIALRTT